MKNHPKHFPKLRMPWPAALPAAVLLAGFITLLSLWCQPGPLQHTVDCFLRSPALIVLNALPVGLLLLTVAFLFRNLFFAAAAVNLFVGGLSIANRIKITVRDEPVFPRDFALLKEVGSAVESYDIHFPVYVLAVVLGVTVVLAVLGVLVGVKPCPVEKLRGWKGSLLGAAGCGAALVLLIVTVLGSDALYNSFPTTNAYRMSVLFNENGFPYSYCRQFTTYLVDKPEGYSRGEAEKWDSAPGEGGQEKDINVVMVMDEAFSDLTDAAVFRFEDDPLANLHAIQADHHAVSGRVVVPGFAGGTANTEFDVLTGMQTNALSPTTTSSMRTVERNLDSVFRVFAAGGYRTSFFHPGNDWFYNRENVYRWLGAEYTLFKDQMPDLTYKGTWISDEYMTGLIQEEFETAVEEGRPLFHYTTTIQNHMSYTANKYGDGYVCPHVDLAVPVSEEVQTMADVYTDGVRDADAMLGQLRDYFAARSEPVLLVFFGDHLPYLGENQFGYGELGLDMGLPQEQREDPMSVYETPYVIWANDAAARALDWDKAVEALALPEDGRLSAAFLGAAVLELTGRGRETPWFAFLNELRREAPVVQEPVYVLASGAETMAPDEALRQDVAKWRKWTYYKLRQKTLKD